MILYTNIKSEPETKSVSLGISAFITANPPGVERWRVDSTPVVLVICGTALVEHLGDGFSTNELAFT